MLPKIIRAFLTTQFIKYALVGGTGALIDFLLFVLFYHRWHWGYWYAAILAFVIAATLSFIGYKFIIFKTKEGKLQFEFVRYALVAAVGLTLTEIILWIAIDLLGIVGWLSKIIALGTVLIWNYTANKFWAFKQTELRGEFLHQEEIKK